MHFITNSYGAVRSQTQPRKLSEDSMIGLLHTFQYPPKFGGSLKTDLHRINQFCPPDKDLTDFIKQHYNRINLPPELNVDKKDYSNVRSWQIHILAKLLEGALADGFDLNRVVHSFNEDLSPEQKEEFAQRGHDRKKKGKREKLLSWMSK